MSGVSKIVAERNHRLLLELVSQPGNDMCAECKSKAPRWASHNLGIFLCVRCASIHRKIGTHVTKVKSLTLDSWSKDQVENMKEIGNIKANSYWNPDEFRHPPPTNMEESERDSELEKYIRAKYEYKRFRGLSERAAEHLGPSQSKASLPARSHTAPIQSDTLSASTSRSERPPLPSTSFTPQPWSQPHPNLSVPSAQTRSASADLPAGASHQNALMTPSSFSQAGLGVQNHLQHQTFGASRPGQGMNTFVPAHAPVAPPNQQASLTNSTFNDLISLQAPSSNSSLPLQYQPTSSFSPQMQASPYPSSSLVSSSTMGTPTGIGGPANPYANLSNSTSGFLTLNHTQNFRSASLPGFGPSSVEPNPANVGAIPSGHNSYQQYLENGSSQSIHAVSPNPFSSQYPGMMANGAGRLQSYPPNAFSPQPQQAGAMLQHNPPFHQSSSPFAVQPNTYQSSQQPMQGQPVQSPGNFDANSPYAQQAQQAHQLFSSMAGRTNPFGS